MFDFGQLRRLNKGQIVQIYKLYRKFVGELQVMDCQVTAKMLDHHLDMMPFLFVTHKK